VMAIVKIYALATIRKQRWLTRDVEVSAKSKQVVRTIDAGDGDAQAEPGHEREREPVFAGPAGYGADGDHTGHTMPGTGGLGGVGGHLRPVPSPHDRDQGQGQGRRAAS
jgi:hypothetical protein